MVGKQITKKIVEKTISKAVPMVGGVVSGGLTYVTFRPMGNRLANVLAANLNGDFDDELELNAEFAASMDVDVIEGDVVQTGGSADGAGSADSD